jgi:hypothetical protein
MISRTLPRLLAALALVSAPLVSARAADEGESIYTATCTKCHDAKNHPLDAVRLPREKWKDQVERMEGLGAEVPTGKKLDALLDWLARTHGPDSPPPAKK